MAGPVWGPTADDTNPASPCIHVYIHTYICIYPVTRIQVPLNGIGTVVVLNWIILKWRALYECLLLITYILHYLIRMYVSYVPRIRMFLVYEVCLGLCRISSINSSIQAAIIANVISSMFEVSDATAVLRTWHHNPRALGRSQK